jgi:hypothetical protein
MFESSPRTELLRHDQDITFVDIRTSNPKKLLKDESPKFLPKVLITWLPLAGTVLNLTEDILGESYEKNRLEPPQSCATLTVTNPNLERGLKPCATRAIIMVLLNQLVVRVAVAAFNPGEAETDTRTRPLNPTVPSPLPITVISMLPLEAELVGFAELTTATS